MKMNKLTILMIAVVAIGVFGLPTTLSVGSGQHKFLQAGSNTTGQTDLVDFCGQCHSTDTLKQSEIDQSDKNLYFGVQDTSRIHSSLFAPGEKGCAACHEIAGGYGFEQSIPRDSSGKTQHAAALPSCLKCHDTGLGLGDAPGELSNTTEAHKDFKSTTDDDLHCIGCHTDVDKTGAVSYTYSAGEEVKGLQIGYTAAGP